jgi:hypothetical protein
LHHDTVALCHSFFDVLTLTAGWAKATEAKAAAEAEAAIRKDNSKAADIFISGVTGRHSVVNGLYSPTQETGQDGRVLYRKSGECGEEALCIEHDEDCWEVKYGRDVYSRAFVRGGCALEECYSRLWRVYDGENHVDQPGVKFVTGDEAKSMASSHSTLAPQCSPSSLSILSRVRRSQLVQAKAAAEAKSAILNDNSKTVDIFMRPGQDERVVQDRGC